MTYQNFVKMAACAVLSLVAAGSAQASNFVPQAGTVITDEAIEVEWTSDAVYQWVRAVDQDGNGLYESGLLAQQTGSVDFLIPSSVQQLRIFFYERPANGVWTTTSREYAVNIDSSDSISPPVSRLADMNCDETQLAKASGRAQGPRWDCREDRRTKFGVFESVDAVLCENDEELVREFDGTIQCRSAATQCLGQYSTLPAQARFMWIGITQKNNSPEASSKLDQAEFCEWNVPRGLERIDSVVLRNDGTLEFLSQAGSASKVEPSSYEYTTRPGAQDASSLLSCAALLSCENLVPAFE